MGIIRYCLFILLFFVSLIVRSQAVRTEEVSHINGPKISMYAVVVGSFGMKVNAEGLQSILKSKGYDASIVQSEKAKMFRVIASSANSISEVKDICGTIKSDYPYAWILCASKYDYNDDSSQYYYAQQSTPVQNNASASPKQSSYKNTSASQPAAPVQSVPAAPVRSVPVAPVQKSLSPVDMNIPSTDQVDRNTFAVIMGNEKYKNVAEVPFAENDAKVFSKYVEKSLGVPREQIKLIENATYNDIRMALSWLEKAMSLCNGKGKAIVYYAGHGIPDESDNSSYLLPVDGIGNDPVSAYSLRDFYQKLGSMQAKSVTVFIDACFSGSKRDNGMLVSARGVAIKAKPSSPKGNMVVFSAAQGDETAYPYSDMQHGMFTYFLLKKLQETKGAVTLGELGDYLKDEVKRQSFLKNNKIQTPMISVANNLLNSWKNLKIK